MAPTEPLPLSGREKELLISYRKTSNPSCDIEDIRRILDSQVANQEEARLRNVKKAWSINVEEVWLDFGSQYQSRRFLTALYRIASDVSREEAHELILDAYVERVGGDRPAAVSSVECFVPKDAENALSTLGQTDTQSTVDPSSIHQFKPAATLPRKRRNSTTGKRSAENDRALEVEASEPTGNATRKRDSYDARPCFLRSVDTSLRTR